MPDFDGLTVSLKLTPDGSHYEFGVTVDGAWLQFGAESSNSVEAKLYEAEQAAKAAAAANPPPPAPAQ